jgi:hypothetical protein
LYPSVPGIGRVLNVDTKIGKLFVGIPISEKSVWKKPYSAIKIGPR